ncbi:MAG: hypothetical protein Q9183_002902 [Haloplaca sp. 2 TL-2023]
MLFVAVFECDPVALYWDVSLEGECIDQNAFYRWNGVANLLIDFGILLLPVPMIWRLNLPTRDKVSLTAIFLLGLLACVASIVRVTSFDEVVWTDISYTIVGPTVWTTVEQSMGIICACLSTLRPLLTRLLPATPSRMKSGGSNRSSAVSKLHNHSDNNETSEDRNPILLASLQSGTLGKSDSKNAPQRMHENQGTDYHLPGESWIRTDVSGGEEPDVESLGEGYHSAIVKKQSIQQSVADNRASAL